MLPGTNHHSHSDEENGLYLQDSFAYGTILSTPTCPVNNAHESGRLTQRRQHRLLHRQSAEMPMLTSRLSNLLVRPENMADVEHEQPDLVLPALDPQAHEVIASIPADSPLDQFFAKRSHVHLSTVRENYREKYKHIRDEKANVCGMFYNAKQCLNMSMYLPAVKEILLGNRSIILFVNLDLIVDLLFCLAYLVEMKQEYDVQIKPGWLYKWRSYDLWLGCQIFSTWDIGSFVIRIFMTRHPSSVLLSFRCFIELLTTVPFLLSRFIPHGQYLYVPYFLRSWVLLLRIKSAIKIKSNLQMTDKILDPLKSKLIHLLGTMLALLYNGMAAFQYCEATFGSIHYDILDCLYVVVVTLSTVGYGDIAPSTAASRLMMMMLIFTSLTVLPNLITGVLDTLRKQTDVGGNVDRGSIPFILIVGTFNPDQVTEILDGFLKMEQAQSHLSIVFLDVNQPPDDLKHLERNSIWGHRVKFLYGSALNDKTLQRVHARYAQAIFTLSNQYATDPAEEDERNTVRLWSFYCYTVRHNVPIYTYNLSPSTAIYQKVAKEIICIREFKQYLLAMNCRCRGASTLLTNLLHQRQHMNRYTEPWQAQYDDGSCNEIYMAPPAKSFVGVRFGHAAWLIFKQCQVILFAIKSYSANRDAYTVLLNPHNTYMLQEKDVCVYMAESPREIHDIDLMSSMFVNQMIGSLKQRSVFVPKDSVGLRNSASSRKPKDQATGVSTSSVSQPSSASSISSRISKSYRIAKLPSPRHAMLSGGSKALIACLDQRSSPDTAQDTLLSCHLLDGPATLDDVLLQSASGFSNHILVCLHRKVVNIFKFIYNLRSPHMHADELQDIVFLCPTLPSEKTFDLINMFPRIYFIVGNCRYPDDLLRSGVKTAKQVVVMSEKECSDQNVGNSDSPAIMSSHIMDLLLKERSKSAYTIVNLVEKSNIRFMHLLQGRDVAEEIDVFYTPAYASGDVVADSLISSVLLSQTYYKPDIVAIFKHLIDMPTLDASTPSSSSETSDQIQDVPSSTDVHHLSSIPLPTMFAKQSFAYMFEVLLLDHGILPVGLLRAPDKSFGNEQPFVYANPVPSLLLKETDMVYILAPHGWAFHDPRNAPSL